MTGNEELIHHLFPAASPELSDLKRAFRLADRKLFVRRQHLDSAYQDRPLSIGYYQTISQPYTVCFMLRLLDVKPGMSVLDIGCGSGWTTALLSILTGREGAVKRRAQGLCLCPAHNKRKSQA